MAFFTRRETPRPPMENLELLRTAADEIELSMIRGILDENGIAYVTRERDGASYLRVMAGYTMFGVDVYVDRNDLARAGNLLDDCLSGTEEDAEIAANEYADAVEGGFAEPGAYETDETDGTDEADEADETEKAGEDDADADRTAAPAPGEPSVLRRLMPVIVAILLILVAAFAVSRA